ncbi:MAG: ABC transporter substrate-binding protein [Pseudomonadota bacterium]
MRKFQKTRSAIVRSVSAVVAYLFVSLAAHAATIAVSLPLSGDFAELGAEFRRGAELALAVSNTDHTLRFFDDGCDPDFGRMAADDLKNSQPGFVTGYLCSDPAIAAADALSGSGVPIVVANARSVRLVKDRERGSWNLWRLAPGDNFPVVTAATAIADNWRSTPFAIVDDGTIYGRTFTDQLRLELEERGLKAQFSDNFRAAQSTQAGLLRRLQRAGVTAAFIAAASIEDLFTIAKDAKALDIEISLMTTEALASLPFLESRGDATNDLAVIAAPKPFDNTFETLLRENQIASTGLVYEGYAAIEIALQALAGSAKEATNNLRMKTFETVLGPVEFKEDGTSNYNPYRLLLWDGKTLSAKIPGAESQ